jgi:hypothetical protein
MTCFTHEEAVYAYTQRRPPYWRSYKKIAKELGKSERSTVRAIGRIALERRTYGPSWTRMRLEHKREGRQLSLQRFAEQARKDAIAKQSAAEHAAMVELSTRAALGSTRRETRAERTERVERELASGTVRVEVNADGHAGGDGRGFAALPLSPAERAAKRKARLIREMLGPNPMRHELGL